MAKPCLDYLLVHGGEEESMPLKGEDVKGQLKGARLGNQITVAALGTH